MSSSRLHTRFGRTLVLIGILAAIGGGVRAADLKSPALVNTSLKIFAGVYGDMDRKLSSGQFDRLPHENQEFQDGAAAMRDATAGEPAEFQAKVQAQLTRTLSASAGVAEASKSHDAAQVKAALATLADNLQQLNALFPPSLRVAPGAVAPPRGSSGPPSGAH